MGPRQYKQRTYSTKPCDDVTGPGPPIFQKRQYTQIHSRNYKPFSSDTSRVFNIWIRGSFFLYFRPAF